MKVLDLQCAQQHLFEGWFGSEDDFASQLARGLVACPLCGDAQIQKMLSAPRLNLRAGRAAAAAPDTDSAQQEGGPAAPAAKSTAATAAAAAAAAADTQGTTTTALSAAAATALPALQQRQMQARLLTAMRKLLADTEDVGPRFANEARAMHEGEKAARGIRGQATPEEAQALLEDGIAVMPLPSLPGIKETLQ